MSHDNLMVRVADPIWMHDGQSDNHLTLFPDSYSHTNKAVGGFDSATIQFAASRLDADEWLDRSIGHHIEAVTASQGIVWEGFIDEVEVRYGRTVYKIGPLSTVANRVDVVYQTVSYTALGITIGGDRRSTGWVDHEDSQGRYGIMELIFSAGQTHNDLADQLQLTVIEERREPARGQEIALQTNSPGDFGVTLRCKGYHHMFNHYYYQNLDGGFIPAHMQVVNAIQADPNGLLKISLGAPHDLTSLTTPIVQQYEEGERRAWDVITDMITLGDMDNKRILFGVYQDRTAHLYTIPIELQYLYYLNDPSQRIAFVGGGEASYFDVRAGQWLQVVDMMVADHNAMAHSYRDVFLESVEYQHPLFFRGTSGDTDVTSMMLKRFGIGSYA
jgi:hypothetical protein